MSKKVGYKFHASVLTFAFGMGLFLSMSGKYFSGVGADSEPSYTRSFGLPWSPWLVLECGEVQITHEPNCLKWEPSFSSNSWSWLVLLVSIGAAIYAWKLNKKSSAET